MVHAVEYEGNVPQKKNHQFEGKRVTIRGVVVIDLSAEDTIQSM